METVVPTRPYDITSGFQVSHTCLAASRAILSFGENSDLSPACFLIEIELCQFKQHLLRSSYVPAILLNPRETDQKDLPTPGSSSM